MTDIAERVAAIEARDQDMLRRMDRFDERQEEQTATLHRIETQLERQAAVRSLTGYVADSVRIVASAIVGAFVSSHWLAR